MSFDIQKIINSGKLAFMRHSPEILVFAGIGGGIASAVMACRATRRLEPVMEEHKKGVGIIRKVYKDDETGGRKEMARVYTKTGAEIIKLYGPSAALGMLSITSILAGNHILRRRNVALAAAYATIDGSFRQYRERAEARFGEEAGKELLTGARQEKIETIETDEDGKEKKVKKSVAVMDGEPSDYARIFAYGEAKAAEPNSDYNEFFLRAQQELANHMLRANGYLFLNDVYDMLGIDRSVAGQAVGWVYDRHDEEHGDNFVDFGIQEIYRKKDGQDVGFGEYEKVFLLNFNVDGGILTHAQDKGLITK